MLLLPLLLLPLLPLLVFGRDRFFVFFFGLLLDSVAIS
jgi:hypothetical protein